MPDRHRRLAGRRTAPQRRERSRPVPATAWAQVFEGGRIARGDGILWNERGSSRGRPSVSEEEGSQLLRVLIASSNPGKVAEYRTLFNGSTVGVSPVVEVGSGPLVEESGATYAENARVKACAWAAAWSGWALADDSGLEVAALAGRPGIHSSRFAGPNASDIDRNAWLLAELARVPDADRTAVFRCAIAVAGPDGRVEFEVEATCRGQIIDRPRGTGGFGYDPLFLLADAGRTMAELDLAEKNARSHRGIAARAARRYLERVGGSARGAHPAR